MKEFEIDFDDRMSWSFQYMAVGDVKGFHSDKFDLAKLQKYVHAYGANAGKKFRTRTKDYQLFVKRVA